MSLEEFEEVVDRVLEHLPGWVIERIDNLIVVVEDWAPSDDDQSGDGLLGIYEGVSLLERSGDYWGGLPDQITIYRRPHLALGLTRANLENEIRRTVLHELAHHLGIDDRRLEDIGWD